MNTTLPKKKRNLFRNVREFIFGLVLMIGGIYLQFNDETEALSQPYLYASLGLLCILLGTILLVDGILSHLERKSA